MCACVCENDIFLRYGEKESSMYFKQFFFVYMIQSDTTFT